jgi:hypothetical protein
VCRGLFAHQTRELLAVAVDGAGVRVPVGGSSRRQDVESTMSRANTDRLAGYLQRRLPAMKLHDRVMLLWASSRWGGVLSDAQRAAIAGELARTQRADGGWSFAGTDTDAHATALATLALCETTRAG